MFMNTYHPFFSIIIPAFQVGDYLCECLLSVRKQTFESFEVLCVYDESTDKTLNVIEYYTQHDYRFRRINGENKGLSSARNKGIEEARGQYIIFLDGDDMIRSNMLKHIYDETLREAADIIIFGADYLPPNAQVSEYFRHTLSPEDAVYVGDCTSCIFHIQSAKPFVWRDVFRADFLINNQLLFCENIHIAEDVAFQFASFARAKCVRFITKKLYLYRVERKESLMQHYNANPKIRLNGHLQVIKEVIKDYSKINKIHTYGKDISVWALDFIVGSDFYQLPPSVRSTICKETLLLCKKAYDQFPKRLPLYTRYMINKMLTRQGAKVSVPLLFRLNRKWYHVRNERKLRKRKDFRYGTDSQEKHGDCFWNYR